MLLPGVLTFAAVLLLIFTIIYSFFVTLSDPRRKRKDTIYLGTFTLGYILLSLNDVPGAMSYLTQVSGKQAIFPVLKTLCVTGIIVWMTMRHARNADNYVGAQVRSNRIFSSVVLIAGVSILSGLAYVVLRDQSVLTFLYRKSIAASWVGSFGVFLTSFAAVYGAVYSLINQLPMRWLSVGFLVVYFVFFSAEPPEQVKGMMTGKTSTLLNGLRPYGLGLSLLFAVLGITIGSDKAKLSYARALQDKEDH